MSKDISEIINSLEEIKDAVLEVPEDEVFDRLPSKEQVGKLLKISHQLAMHYVGHTYSK